MACQGVQDNVTRGDEALYEVIPTHPVTGRPMANVVSEERQVAIARSAWQRVESGARAEAATLDP